MSGHRAYGRPKRESRGCNAYFCITTVRYVKEGGRWALFARAMSAANRSLPAALERESSFLRRLCIPRYASRRLQRRKNSGSRTSLGSIRELKLFFPFLFISFGAYFLHESRNDGFRDFY